MSDSSSQSVSDGVVTATPSRVPAWLPTFQSQPDPVPSSKKETAQERAERKEREAEERRCKLRDAAAGIACCGITFNSPRYRAGR